MRPKPSKPYKAPDYGIPDIPPRRPGEVRWVAGEKICWRMNEFVVVHAVVVAALWVGHFAMTGVRAMGAGRQSSS